MLTLVEINRKYLASQDHDVLFVSYGSDLRSFEHSIELFDGLRNQLKLGDLVGVGVMHYKEKSFPLLLGLGLLFDHHLLLLLVPNEGLSLDEILLLPQILLNFLR